MDSVYKFSAKNIKGKEVSLKDYQGKVLLIVNVASRCGYTPQYKGLEELYKEYGPQGFEVLAFPCNQFGAQEPGTSEAIENFCDISFKTTFPLFEKIEVNGNGAHPLYTFLKQEQKGILGTGMIKWNFTKFLVNREGQVVERFAPTKEPADIAGDIKKLL